MAAGITLTTTPIYGSPGTTATGGGEITNLNGKTMIERGIVYGLTINPTVEVDTKIIDPDTGLGVFVSELTDLTSNVMYHVRAYAINSVAAVTYGGDEAFLLPTTPTVDLTNDITDISFTTATGGGDVSSAGGAAVTAGLVWNTTGTPTIDSYEGITTDSSSEGPFVSSLTGLLAGTHYFVCAYATNYVGTSYGPIVEFDTSMPSIPTVSVTNEITSIDKTTATGGGTISDDGGGAITACGLADAGYNILTIETGSVGDFVSNLTGLIPGTNYSIVAYATNIAGTGYGPVVSFDTLPAVAPTVSLTDAIGTIHQTTAVGGGTVSDDGGSALSDMGLIWSTESDVSFSNYSGITHETPALGSFTSTLTDLLAGTKYYVKAYVTNSIDTTFGNEVHFTTSAAIAPTITTTSITSLSYTTAISGGNVSDDGGATITARGVCWATTINPTTANTKTTNGTGTGTFTSSLTGLLSNTTYHVRAYATNSVGTSYGTDLTITTLALSPIVTTLPTFIFGRTTATLRADITGDNGFVVSERGIYWGTTNNPVGAGTKVVSPGTENGYFETLVTGLPIGTVIYFVSYAINSKGTGYGTILHFSTIAATVPSIGTLEPISPVFYSVISGGTNVEDGGDTLNTTGIVWSITPNPTLNDNVVTNSGDNYNPFSLSFISDFSQVYHIKAFATNDIGTGYGNEVTITSAQLDMKMQHIERIPIIEFITFTGKVPFDKSLSICQTYLTSELELVPNPLGAIPGYKSLYRLVGDGSHIPTFSGFKPMSTTTAYDATIYTVNLVEFLFDGIDYWYTILSGGSLA